MSDNDKFQECLDCPGCSGDCGQGCGSCPENKPKQECGDSTVAAVDLTLEADAAKEASVQAREVEVNPMDTDEVAQKTEDLRPKVDPSRGKLDCFNYLAGIPGGMADYDIVEVQFKNTRKGFYRNTSHLDLKLGDMVAVESQPGHDIGRVTLVGHLVRNQMRKAGLSEDSEIRKIFRFARESDMEKYYEAKALEIPTMIGSRQIAAELGLKMKIGDVEYQGDGLKAIFYYIADERVDFRQLIKILAERFKIRVEMRQIGARQEAGRIGGIGPCGRPLCCSTWMTNFVTVATSAARHQDLSLNPQKLAGQCAKLKCCLNFEIDTYLESVRKMPPKETRLETMEASWYHFKTDIFKGEITYSSDKKNAVNTVTITAERAFEIIEMNSRGEKPVSLIPDEEAKSKAQGTYNDILGDDSQIGRFDKKKKKKKKKKDKDKEAVAGASADTAANDSSENHEEGPSTDNTPQANTPQANNPSAPKAKEQSKSKQKNKDNAEVKPQKEISDKGPVENSEQTLPEQTSAESPKDELEERVQESNEVKTETSTEIGAEAKTPAKIEAEGESQVKAHVDEAKSESDSEPEPQSQVEPVSENETGSQTQQPVEASSESVSHHESKESEIGETIETPTREPKVEISDNLAKEDSEAEAEGLQHEAPSRKDEVNEPDEAKGDDEIVENAPQGKHHHQSHHHHHGHNAPQEAATDNGTEVPESRDQGRKGPNPNKPQWQGKNPGKGFKPQQGKGPELPRNREQGQGNGFKPQGGKGQGQEPSQQGQPHQGQPKHPHPQQPRHQEPGQQPQGRDGFKPKAQNPSQERRNNPDNPGRGFKPQHQGGPRDGQPGHPNQGPNGPREDFHGQGQGNPNKKKKKKSYPGADTQGNPKDQSQQGEPGHQHHGGHYNPNRPQQGPRQGQNPAPKNPNAGNGSGE